MFRFALRNLFWVPLFSIPFTSFSAEIGDAYLSLRAQSGSGTAFLHMEEGDDHSISGASSFGSGPQIYDLTRTEEGGVITWDGWTPGGRIRLKCEASKCSAHDYSSIKADLKIDQAADGGFRATGRVNLHNVWATMTKDRIQVAADLSYTLNRVEADQESLKYEGWGSLHRPGAIDAYQMKYTLRGSLRGSSDIGLRLIFLLIPFVGE